MQKKIIFIGFFLTGKIFSHEYDQITRFFLKYQAPTKIAYLLKILKKELMVDESDGYCSKGYNHEKIFNAIRLKNLIEKENLNLIEVANHYIDCSDEDAACKIIIEKIDEITRKVSFEELNQLIRLAQRSGYYSFNSATINHKNNKITLIETDNCCFIDKTQVFTEEDIIANNKALFKDYIYQNQRKAFQYIVLTTLLKEFPTYLNKEQAEIINNTLDPAEGVNLEEIKAEIITIPLPLNNTLDPEDFNLEEIKEAITTINRQRQI